MWLFQIMQIIQQGLDEKDSCYLIYNTAVLLDLKLSFWILNNKPLVKIVNPSSTFPSKFVNPFKNVLFFLSYETK